MTGTDQNDIMSESAEPDSCVLQSPEPLYESIPTEGPRLMTCAYKD